MQQRHTKRTRSLHLCAMAALVLAVSSSLLPLAISAPAGAAPATSLITVAVVVEVDHHQTIRCVTVKKGSSAFEILEALSRSLGWPPPTSDTAWPGFICSIRGIPSSSTSCLSKFDAEASTWGFWLGATSKWHYATVGAASTAPKNQDVEGWVLEPGTARRAKIAQPGIAANFVSLCGKQTAVTSSTPQKSGSSHIGSALAAVGLILGLGSAGVVISRRRRGSS